MNVGFRALTATDLPQLHEWLQRPHVRRWWGEPRTLADVEEHYLPALEGRDPTDHYLILLDGRPVGMVETYFYADHPESEALVRVGPGVAGVDLLIGEEELTGRGLGPQVLRAFAREVVFAEPATIAAAAGVDVENERSLRAFEKAGFRPVRDFVEDGRPHRLLRLERPR